MVLLAILDVDFDLGGWSGFRKNIIRLNFFMERLTWMPGFPSFLNLLTMHAMDAPILAYEYDVNQA